MPAFNLTVEDSSVEDVTITQAGDVITVGGTYILSVKNSGVLPVFMGATLTVDKLVVTGVVAEEGKSSTISGSGEVEIDFSFTRNTNQYLDTAQSLCSGQGQMDIESSGRIDGLVLGSSFNQSVRTTIPNAQCNLESGNGGQEPGNGNQDPPEDGIGTPEPPEPGPDPEPPTGTPEPPDDGDDGDNGDDGGGDGGGGDVPPPSDGSQPNPEGTEIVNISGEQGNYDDPYVGTVQTYRLEQNGNMMSGYADPSEFTWTWDFGAEERIQYGEGDGGILGPSTASQDYAWEETGEKTVQLSIVRRETGRVYLLETLEENVVENEGGGGLFTLDESEVPSMSEAADMKEREY